MKWRRSAVKVGRPASWALWSGIEVILVVLGAVAGALVFGRGAGAAVGAVVSAAVGVLARVIGPVRKLLDQIVASRLFSATVGAASTVLGRDFRTMRVHVSERDDTVFAPRSLLPTVEARLLSGSPVLITGRSMAGKTRLAVEVIRCNWPDRPMFFPEDDDALSRLVGSGDSSVRRESVVFLDDAD